MNVNSKLSQSSSNDITYPGDFVFDDSNETSNSCEERTYALVIYTINSQEQCERQIVDLEFTGQKKILLENLFETLIADKKNIVNEDVFTSEGNRKFIGKLFAAFDLQKEKMQLKAAIEFSKSSEKEKSKEQIAVKKFADSDQTDLELEEALKLSLESPTEQVADSDQTDLELEEALKFSLETPSS